MEKKEAMKILKDFHDKSALFLIRTALDTVIPELKESDCEMIRKELISHFKETIENIRSEEIITHESKVFIGKIRKWIAWLEKQGENISLPKFTYDDVLALQCCMETAKKVQEDKELYERLQSLHNRLYDAYWVEKQGKQKSIISNDALREGIAHFGITQYQIDNWLKKYVDVEKQGGQKPVSDWMPKFLDELRSKKNYFDWDEHKDIEGRILAIIKWMSPNYFNEKDGEQKPADNKGMNIDEESMTPFQKKVFCIIDTSIEEEQGLKQVCDELLALASNEIEQKPAWSEVDETVLNNLIYALANDRIGNNRDEYVNWLKSLRPQNTWKPSLSQLNALGVVVKGNAPDDIEEIKSLYNNLKKLREE